MARFCQCALEVIGRVLCELTPEEAMTHPSDKATMPNRHEAEVKRRVRELGSDAVVYLVKNSNDAKKWSQTHHV